MLKKMFLVLGLLILVIIVSVLVFVNTSYDKDYSELYPASDLRVVADFTMIERGKYLAHGPAHCAHCHIPFKDLEKLEAGEEVAMQGGFDLTIPPGTFHAANITSDKETGIGAYSDGEIYRMLRYNINVKGEACIDFMPFINMSDDDIYAIIAYIRTVEPVANQVPERELSFLGKMIFAVGGIAPGVPNEPIPISVTKEVSIAYGEYLAYSVANCRGCHTNRDLKTGEYIGKDYSGWFVMGPDNMTQNWLYTSPNITPDTETGIMVNWTEEDFIHRMRMGRVYETSPMPWGAFKNLDDNDLKALYMFLMSLKPVKNEIGKIAIEPQS